MKLLIRIVPVALAVVVCAACSKEKPAQAAPQPYVAVLPMPPAQQAATASGDAAAAPVARRNEAAIRATTSPF